MSFNKEVGRKGGKLIKPSRTRSLLARTLPFPASTGLEWSIPQRTLNLDMSLMLERLKIQQEMEKIAILSDDRQSKELCALLENRQYQPILLDSFPSLKSCLHEVPCLAVILDFDTISVDNRDVRDLTMQNPGVHFLGLSSRHYHPELRESICYYIYAFLTKPVDLTEVVYWLESIKGNQTNLINQKEA
jgi:hypothetical protein